VSTQILSLGAQAGASQGTPGQGYEPAGVQWGPGIPPATLTPATVTDINGVVWTISGVFTITGVFIVYALHNGASIAPKSMFTSVSFTDDTSVLRTFTSASATYFATNFAGVTEWEWSLAVPFTAGNTYPISFNFPSPAPAVPPSATGGQTLSPNRNVNAPAGFGGDIWGANGGGVTPYVITPATDKSVLVALSDCELPANALLNLGALNDSESVASGLSNAALLGQTLNSTLPTGGSNAG
jgi:hypothetical protein